MGVKEVSSVSTVCRECAKGVSSVSTVCRVRVKFWVEGVNGVSSV